MADQGFRPLTTTTLSSSVNAAPIMIPIWAPVQMPVLPSNSAEDGYIWKNSGLQEIPGSGPLICYECSQANCTVKKSVTLSADGQILETVLRGSHNHPRPSEMCPKDAPIGYIPAADSQYYHVSSDMYVAGTSISHTEGGEHEQIGSSSDSDEEDDGEQGADGHVANPSTTERNVVAPAERITVRTRSGTSPRKPKSKVWEEFTKVLRDGKLEAAVCKHCESSLSAKTTGGTSHLRRHLKTCPARPSTATGRVQQQLSYSHPESSVEKNPNLDQDKSLELLTKALVSNLCSFSLTSSTNYRRFLAGICPTYDVVSQSAVQDKFLSIFQNEKLKLKEEISVAHGGIFLTVAKWVLGSKFFICVTAHFIDKEWNIIRRIIRCSFAGSKDENMTGYISMFPDFESYHSANTNWDEYDDEPEPGAKEIIQEVVRNWSLDKKLVGILLFPKSMCQIDMSSLQKNLAENNYLVGNNLLSLPCITESLGQLLCYNRWNVEKLSADWFKYMTCSPLRTEKYKEILLQLQMNRPTFGSKKWYLTFYSLEAALQFNKVFPNPAQLDFKSHPSKPSDQKLQDTEDFCKIARLIYQAIEVASSPCNATLNSNFHTIWNLKIALMRSSEKAQNDFHHNSMRSSEKALNDFHHNSMKKKFDELWEKWYLWLSLAVVLDPRYKIRFLDRSLKEAFGSDAKKYMLEVRGKICELFFRYSIQADQQGGGCSNASSTDVPVHEGLGELNHYLEGECVPENVPFDIMKWWKGNASMYPTLALLARDILRIPACVVSTESAFDETDERVSLFNRKLSPEVVEALICNQDWIKSSETKDDVCGNTNMPA
ncbi:zinc finger BED domain-containing protein RICESLEEPER 2 [Sorghum bicolor]|uniref:zinc finger BED domain-containing protein RICESLEEPER 2 n=1 Tax=Sorghum bicolor TaxID=4558 RepID=UPI00081ABCC7|nr:zinc finger BED domain-containing protein RICESLEEPER 2 [Sorghum bicolor]XP_021320427.1 zinc finger BED domain-containing protein RICESLEEPER 2 [Sorghum bicolor]|eukprot:XP_021320426.1 zinc finger BED domain-containing protein RICESLEEPER 2 [Sorghum bicolor]